MFRNRSLAARCVLLTLIVAVTATAVAFATRSRSFTQTIQDPATQAGNESRPARASANSRGEARFRNLLLQPEAAKMSRRLGQRFSGSDSDVLVMMGELIEGDKRIPLRVVRRQNKLGESVEIAGNGKTLAWHGPAAKLPPAGFDRSLLERIIFDSPDAFVLAQLRGASYHVIAKNMRADLGGADHYDGPLWTVVRVKETDPDANPNRDDSVRLFYINSNTGLIDKVVSEADGEPVEALLENWTTVDGETFPSLVRWTRNGTPIMQLRIDSFLRPERK